MVRSDDTLETLKEKVELAAILGTIQATLTDFRYLRPIWKKNADEEALLGVSMTGIYDHPVLNGSGIGFDIEAFPGDKTGTFYNLESTLYELQKVVVDTNRIWAEKLGINPSGATTTVKPAGTTSAISNTANGIHPRHSEYYIRSVRQDNKDPLTEFLKFQGVPWEPCVVRPETTSVFFFPIASPEGAKTRDDISAIDHLNLWGIYNKHWAEHQVSVTVSVKENEWMQTAAWVYDNFDTITGISFLPFDSGTYRQPPFRACSYEEYQQALDAMPKEIDWNTLSVFETMDSTKGSQELACSAGGCEVT